MKGSTGIILGGSLALSIVFGSSAVLSWKEAEEVATHKGAPYSQQPNSVRLSVDKICKERPLLRLKEKKEECSQNQSLIDRVNKIAVSNAKIQAVFAGSLAGAFAMGLLLMGVQARRENRWEKARQSLSCEGSRG